MRIVFLDIDGVLNSDAWVADNPEYMNRTTHEWKDHLDPACVAHLNRLLDKSGARMVLSSTWRKSPIGVETTAAALLAVGLEARFMPFLGCTPSLSRTPEGVHLQRGDEIQDWLSRAAITPTAMLFPSLGVAFGIPRHQLRQIAGPPRTVSSFVILDDGTDMAHLTPRLVRTDWLVGLTDADVDAALALLS